MVFQVSNHVPGVTAGKEKPIAEKFDSRQHGNPQTAVRWITQNNTETVT